MQGIEPGVAQPEFGRNGTSSKGRSEGLPGITCNYPPNSFHIVAMHGMTVVWGNHTNSLTCGDDSYSGLDY